MVDVFSVRRELPLPIPELATPRDRSRRRKHRYLDRSRSAWDKLGILLLGGLMAGGPLLQVWRETRAQRAAQMPARHRVVTPDELVLDRITLQWRLTE